MRGWGRREGRWEGGRERERKEKASLWERKGKKLKTIPLNLMKPHWTSPKSKSKSQRQMLKAHAPRI